ncbi:stage V sporulation protein AB [Bacillus andreraoultii]|uniref:stage V sporulation protein AB n=1 Tax=Bacillus andreraoultii TaxID=1499685 RepID=UPI00053ABDF2|nr:stage V sporulation protein AB [Bacillus andreraoultii]
MGLKILFVLAVGLACGLAVGAGFVAFITVLGVIPRLMQLTKSMKMILYYEWAATLGVIFGAILGLQQIQLTIPKVLMIFVGLFQGIFVGMLAAALYEAVNVLPLIFKRINLEDRLLYLLTALILGKILGSLFHWLYFINL